MTTPQKTARNVTPWSRAFCAAALALGCEGTARTFADERSESETIGEVSTGVGNSAMAPSAVSDGTFTSGSDSELFSTNDSESERTTASPSHGMSTSEPTSAASNIGQVVSSAEQSESVSGALSETSSVEGTSSNVAPPSCDAVLLRNGDFESGGEYWVASSSYGAFEQRVHPLIVDNGHESLAPYSVNAREGSRLAFLGDVPDDEYMGYHTTLTQVVTIPEDSAGLWLTGYVWVNTAETENSEFDYAYIQLEPSDDEDKYLQFAFWTNLDAADGWIGIDEYMPDVDALRGREVNLVIQALTDANVATRFWFDSLALVSLCPE